MGKRNWIEFQNEANIYQKPKEQNTRKLLKINISKQKKGNFLISTVSLFHLLIQFGIPSLKLCY